MSEQASPPPGRTSGDEPTDDRAGQQTPSGDPHPQATSGATVPEPPVALPAPSSAPPAGASRTRGRQTALDMVRSMVVILAFVGGVLLLAPQPDRVVQPQVGGAQAATSLQEATTLLGAAPLLPAPAGLLDDAEVPPEAVVELGEDWRLDYARTEVTDEIDTWRVGVLSPDDRRVDLEQATDPTEQWLTRRDAGRPGLPEPVEVGGLTWTVQERGDGDSSWAWTDPDGGLTTAVSAPSDSADLRAVVEAVSAALSR